jgi:hypothetical protein
MHALYYARPLLLLRLLYDDYARRGRCKSAKPSGAEEAAESIGARIASRQRLQLFDREDHGPQRRPEVCWKAFRSRKSFVRASREKLTSETAASEPAGINGKRFRQSDRSQRGPTGMPVDSQEKANYDAVAGAGFEPATFGL